MTDPALAMDLDTMFAQLAERDKSPAVVVGPGRPEAYVLDGHAVPSVTTVLDSWHPGGVDALCQWAHRTALGDPAKGIAPSHWRVLRDEAGDFGTSMHDYCTRLDTGEDADEIARQAEAEWSQEGRHAFSEYERWRKLYQPDFSHMEVPLYSKRYGFAGTFDRRERCGKIGDLKGAKVGRVTMIAQLGAYAQLLEENGLGWPMGGWLLHFPRSLVDPRTNKVRTFKHYTFTSGELLAGRDAFLRILDAHRIAEDLQEALRQ